MTGFGLNTENLITRNRVPASKNPVRIRQATNEDGPVIRDLLKENGYQFPDELDWSQVSPFWLLAVVNNEVVGTIQPVPGHPLGAVEFLSVRQGLSQKVKVLVVRDLLIAAFGTLRAMGVQYAYGFISFERKDFKEFLRSRFGISTLATGNIVVKKLGS